MHPQPNEDYRTSIPLFESLQGPRVLLRPYEVQDAEALFEAVEESRAYLSQWIGFPQGHTSVAQSRDWIIRQQARWLLREDMPAGLWDISTHRFLGDCRLFPQSWEWRTFSLSYWLRESAAGHGFMTEGVGLWMRFAFESLQAARLEISCDARNDRSAAVAHRLGFVQEGRLRNHRRAPNDSLCTTLIFSRIPGD